MGQFIAVALIAQERVAVLDLQPFYGSGVYALYYTGSFPVYSPISGSESPIYIGKADPGSEVATTPREQGDRLHRRLKDHARNIDKVENLDIADFHFKHLVVKSGWQEPAEDFLIEIFRPIWNQQTNICYGFGKHGDDPRTRKNLRSPWDTLHPGRDWAWRDETMADARSHRQIEADLRKHFGSNEPFNRADEVFQIFAQGLRQQHLLSKE